MRLRYREVRAHSLVLAQPLSAEDQCIQSIPDASPTQWHLVHTTWFFETLVLQPHVPGYQVFEPHFHYLFNAYYEALGPRHPRVQRGLLTRPSLAAVHAYRGYVDQDMQQQFDTAGTALWKQVAVGHAGPGFAFDNETPPHCVVAALHPGPPRGELR